MEDPVVTKKKPKRLRRERRLPIPDAASQRVEKIAYLPPELAAAATAKQRGLGVSWSKYVCDLVRADLQ